jgi:hypothetical protein
MNHGKISDRPEQKKEERNHSDSLNRRLLYFAVVRICSAAAAADGKHFW